MYLTFRRLKSSYKPVIHSPVCVNRNERVFFCQGSQPLTAILTLAEVYWRYVRSTSKVPVPNLQCQQTSGSPTNRLKAQVQIPLKVNHLIDHRTFHLIESVALRSNWASSKAFKRPTTTPIFLPANHFTLTLHCIASSSTHDRIPQIKGVDDGRVKKAQSEN